MEATPETDWVFANRKTPAQSIRKNGWARLKGWAHRTQQAVDAFERKRLDPLLDRALSIWGDQRQVQRYSLGTADTLVDQLTASDRQLNHGIYLTSGSLAIAIAGRLLYPPLLWLSAPGLAYGAAHLYLQAYHTLRDERRVDVNVLAALVNTAYIGGGYWVLGNLTNASYFMSTKLLKTVKEQLKDDLIHSLRQHPRFVWVTVDGQEMRQRLDKLQAGDVIIVYGGEVLPIDGIVCEGVGMVDEQMLTGEASPVEKSVGDRVLSATLLLSGKLFIRMEQAGTETAVAQISKVLEQTVDFRSTRQLRMQTLTDSLVIPFGALAALSLPFLGTNGAAAIMDSHPGRELNIYSGLGILSAFAHASEQGMLIKDGRTLELLQQIDTVIFDKTGTLTQEEPVVVAIHCVDGVSSEQLLTYAASAEQYQSHPIARAILSAANRYGIVTPLIDEATLKVGMGVTVKTVGETILVGSRRFMALHTIEIPVSLQSLQPQSETSGHLMIWVAREKTILGVLELEIALRPEAKQVVTALRQFAQIHTIMIVSGDTPLPTEQAALEIGADAWYAETLPADKAKLVARLQAAGRKVCFVGDGINDAIALKQAHVSVSMRGATSAALDTAHVVLMDATLDQLPALFELAQRVEHNQKILMAPLLGTSVLGLGGIFFCGWGLTATTVLDLLGKSTAFALLLKQRSLAQK